MPGGILPCEPLIAWIGNTIFRTAKSPRLEFGVLKELNGGLAPKGQLGRVVGF